MSKALPLPSDRSFGFTFVVVFLLVAAWAAWTGRATAAFVSVALSATTLLIAIVQPAVLHPLNRAWMKLGAVLHAVVNPIILGGIFFLLITPVGVFMRMIDRDALHRRLDPQARSYWIERTPPGPAPDSLPKQF